MNYVKIGDFVLSEQEAQKCCQEVLYLVSYTKVYQVFYSPAQRQYYGQPVYVHHREKGQPGLVKRGKYAAMTGEQVNRLIGFSLLRV